MPPLEKGKSRECSGFWFLRKAIRSGSMPQILEALRIKSKKRTEVIEGTETPEGMNLYDWRDFKGDFTEDTQTLFDPDDYSELDLNNTNPENLIIVNRGVCFVGRKIPNEEWGWRIEFKTDSWMMTSAIVNTFDEINAEDVYQTIRNKMVKNKHYDVWDNVFAHYGKKIEPYEKAVVLARIIWIENNNYVLMISKNKTITLPKSEVEKTTQQECKKLLNWNWELDDDVKILWLDGEWGLTYDNNAIIIQMENREPPIKE